MIKIHCPKLVKISIIPALAFLTLVPSFVFAATDTTINFQGKIVRNDTGYEGLNVTAGNPACVVDGNGNDTCDFEVKYYTAASSGTLLYTEDFANVEIGQYNGAFTLSLGSSSSHTSGTYAGCKGGTCDNLQEVVNATTSLYVELSFSPAGTSSFTETFSRLPIQASAYALKAKYAEAASSAFQFDTAANSSGYSTPSAGMVYYDTTDKALKVYDGSAWSSIGSGSSTGSLFTDGGIFTYLTSLTDSFVLGSSSYTAIGSDSYATYLTGLSSRSPLSFDMTAERLTISGNQAQTGLTVYSNYTSTGAWPVATFKAEGSSFDNTVLQVTQDGTGNILTLQKGSTDAFVFENPLTFYIHPRTDNPTTYANRLYNVNGTLYWNGSAVGSGSSLWTDSGTYSYLTSTTDDVIIGGDSAGNAKFFFDVSTGNLGIGTSTPGAKLDIAGSNSTISNTTGDITISPDKSLVIKANDTSADILTKWENSVGTVLGLINQNGYAAFGASSTSNAILTLGASNSSLAQIHLTAGYDVSSPTSGDMWWDGTSLYFYDGSSSVDLLTSGGGANVLSSYGSAATGGYINLEHDSNSYDVVASGWVCVGGSSNQSCSGGNWKNIQDLDTTVTQNLSNQWSSANTSGIIRSVIKLTDVELSQGINIGTGADGDAILTTNKNINTDSISSSRNCPDAINYNVTSFNVSGTQAVLSGSINPGSYTSCLNSGDEVLLINLMGTTSSYVNLGNFETIKIAGVDTGTNTVTFTTAKTKYYGDNLNDDTNLGTTTGTQHVMLQRVPNYHDVTVGLGYTLTASAWDGDKGGVLYFRANGTVNIAGSVTTVGSGYRGAGNTPAGRTMGKRGESFTLEYDAVESQSALMGAGGGGNGSGNVSNGGGGGAYVSSGSAGLVQGGTAGSGGNLYSTYFTIASDRYYLGSGGGGGSCDNDDSTSEYGGGGGAGGGILMISANIIGVSGSVSSSGGAGVAAYTGTSGANETGGGGGGGGGSLVLNANTLTLGSSLVTASGGVGGLGFSSVSSGGNGGTGRISIYYGNSVSGTTTPTYSGINVGYYSYGVYESGVISTPNAQSYDNLRWESNLNTYGKISVQTRSGSSSDPSDGTWEGWKPYTSGTNYTTLQSMDTYSQWSGTNATVAVGDVTRPYTSIYGFEDEYENTGTNLTKMTSSTNGGYMESTISSTDVSGYDYITFWVRASQSGNVLRIGIGESAGTEQYEDVTIDTANTWQKVYWDLSDISSTSRDAITKLRITNFSTNSNVMYVDNIRGEKLLATGTGSTVASTTNSYFQYRVIFTTTNLSYQPQLNNISFSYNAGYRTVMYDANNVRLYNYTNTTQYLRLEVVASSGSGSSSGGFSNGLAVSHVEDGTNAIAFQFNTSSTYTNPTSKLLSVMNNSTEMMYLDASGNLYVSGTITAGNGVSAALINNSGTTLAKNSLVVLDSSMNNAFTTTTVANMQGAFGVVQGVKLGSDLDSDGNCDNGDTCLVSFDGVVNVKMVNATSVLKGDYVYSSTTAGSGSSVSSTDQKNGLIGVVSSIANAGSGYVQMVFDAQNKVTADLYLNVGFDTNVYHDMYNQLASDYTSMSDAERRGLIEGGQSQSVMFDNFVDSLKIDSTNSTVGIDADAQKGGLWGGLTIDGTVTDSAGNRYLGSSTATLLTSKYYDRTQSGLQDQDSTPATLVNLGIDPSWYNGVALQTATNLSTSYNGSLFNVSGTYAIGSEHGYIDISVTGTTVTGITANIASSDGNCTVSNASLAFGTNYAFTSGSCSGSSITINPVRSTYNSGDKFRVLSWYIEPTTADDRGVAKVFPARSVILGSIDASNGYLTIVDADTQNVWMKFTQSTTGEMLGVALNNVISSISPKNGDLNIGTNGSAATGMYTVSFVTDQAFKYNTSGKNVSNKVIADRKVANTYSVSNSNQALVNNTVNDVSANVVWNKPTDNTTVSGWGYIQGNGTGLVSETVMLPYKFNNFVTVELNAAGNGQANIAPSKLSDCVKNAASGYATSAEPSSITQTSFLAALSSNSTTMYNSSYYFCYTWTATGQVSPKSMIAVATGASGADGGTTIVNKTDQSALSLAIGSQTASVMNENKVVLTDKGSLYIAKTDETTPNRTLLVYYGITGIPSSETSNNQYLNGYYRNVGTSGWSLNGPVYLGSESSNILYLNVTSGTSTIDGSSNTIYIGTASGVSVIQEKQSGNATLADGNDERNGSVQYYTKDYISEKMYGDIRGMWSLNGILTDSSIMADTLTNNSSVTFGSGSRGQGSVFSGSNYLSCTDANCGGTSKLDIGTGQWSLGAWIKTSTSGSAMYIMSKGGISGQYSYLLQIQSDGTAWWSLFNTSNTQYIGVTSKSVLNDSNWHYVVGTWNPSNTTVNIYVDGVLESTASTISGTLVTDSSASFNIGAMNGASLFTGSIDEPFVSATAISSNQVKLMYEDGLRALKGSHTLGNTYNQLNGSTNDVRSMLVTPDNKYMYVGTEGGGISKIDLTSSTRVNTYTTATDPLTSTNNIETLAGRYYPVFSGDSGASGSLMGIDSNGNNSTGMYYSNTMSFDTNSNKAYLWMDAYIDSSDASSSIAVYASNDGGSTYVQGLLIKTNTNGTLPEYEYSFDFTTSNKSYKVKFVLNRGSSNKSTVYIANWGLAQMQLDTADANGMFTNSSDSVANGSYLEVVHGQNTYDLVATGWVFDPNLSKWVEITNTDNNVTQNLSNQWSDANVNGIIRSIVKLTDVELAPGVNVGTGADGNITINSDTNINTQNSITGRACTDGGDAVNYRVTAFNVAGTEATLSTAPSYTEGNALNSCLYPGDEILLINLQGTTTAYTNVGNYETLRVSYVNGTKVGFQTAKTLYYGDSTGSDINIGTATGTQKVMLQRVPNYNNVSVVSGTFSASGWDGNEGGVLFFRASGSVVVNSTISVTGLGYRGGAGGPAARNPGGYLGETYNYAGTSTASGGGTSASATLAGGAAAREATASPNDGYVGGAGGGGGASGTATPDESGGGGGGGGYAGGGGGGGAGYFGSSGAIGGNGGDTNIPGGGGGGAATATSGQGGNAGSAGTNGTQGIGGQVGNNSISGSGGGGSANGGDYGSGGGGGGGLYGVADLSKLMLGSGGGGGGGSANGSTVGENGGNGGGILVISTNSLTTSAGSIVSQGALGGQTTNGGNGGSGSGGSIKLSGISLTLGTNVSAAGGAATNTGNAGKGGGGGVGRIAIYYSSAVSGTTTPTYSGSNVGYYSYGVYESGVISTPNAQSYDNLRWESNLNTYGKISVQTRSGSSSNPSDGTWEGWKPYTSGTNYTTLQSMDTYSQWSGTNATVAVGDVTRPYTSIYGFEDEYENTGTNLTKMTSSTNGGYMESTISSTDISSYDYITFWVRASQSGNVLRIGIGESAGTEQYEDVTIDTANTWQKVYWDLSDITSTSRDAITKIRITNFSTNSNVMYVDNIRGEKLLTTSTGSTVASTPNSYFQYRVIFTTTNLSYQPQLENISLTYSSGFKIQIVDSNTVRLYNNSGKTQKMKLNVAVGGAAVDLRSSQYALNIAPTSAQIDGGTNTNSIWVNKLGTGGNLLKLQTNSNDMLVVNSTGDMTLAGDIAVSGGSLTLGTSGDQGTIRYNSTSNRIEFSNDGVNWLALGDTTRKVVLSAEYAGAVLSGDGTNNTGNMISDNTGSSSNSMNYYNWASTATSLNDYDVRVRFTLPSDFNGWGTTGGVTLNYVTQSTSASNNAVDMYVYKDSSSTIDGTSAGNVSSVAGTWQTVTLLGSNFQYCKNAGDTCVIVLRMYSMNSNYSRVGDIAITYNRSL